MAQEVRRTLGPAARVIAAQEALVMMALVVPHTAVLEVRDMTVLVAPRTMAPEGRHTPGRAVHAMRVPVVHAIRAWAVPAAVVHRSANDGVPFAEMTHNHGLQAITVGYRSSSGCGTRALVGLPIARRRTVG